MKNPLMIFRYILISFLLFFCVASVGAAGKFHEIGAAAFLMWEAITGAILSFIAAVWLLLKD